MTESRRPRRPSFAPVLWGSLALFAVLFALLTYQLSATSASAQRPVVKRKVIERRVVTTVEPTTGAVGEPAITSSAPETSTSAAAVAPVTTGAS